MTSLTEVPAWYWAVATCLSAYYAFRGAVGNWFAHQTAQSKPEAQKLPWWVIVSVFCVHDALFHFVSAIAGFVAVFVGYATGLLRVVWGGWHHWSAPSTDTAGQTPEFSVNGPTSA
jgi:hypothetical protein